MNHNLSRSLLACLLMGSMLDSCYPSEPVKRKPKPKTKEQKFKTIAKKHKRKEKKNSRRKK